jgi:hypothetical protein
MTRLLVQQHRPLPPDARSRRPRGPHPNSWCHETGASRPRRGDARRLQLRARRRLEQQSRRDASAGDIREVSEVVVPKRTSRRWPDPSSSRRGVHRSDAVSATAEVARRFQSGGAAARELWRGDGPANRLMTALGPNMRTAGSRLACETDALRPPRQLSAERT